MKTILAVALLCALIRALPAAAQTQPDSAAIRATALDYIEGWYEGDAARMERAVHPELVKRIVARRDGHEWIDQMGATRLVAGTRAGFGRETPAEARRTDVTILDVYENVASVRVDAGGWIDYMHLARIEGRWWIVNVLWENRPRDAAE